MRITALCFATLAACAANDGAPKSGGGDDSGAGLSGPWTLVSDEISGGVLLSAWSDGEVLHVVGGDLGGGPGVMLHGDANELCIEDSVTERALWWIHGDQSGRWTAVGEAGLVLTEEDGVRARMDIPTEATMFGVWMDDGVTWAAGGHVGGGENSGEIWRHDGEQWEAFAIDLPNVLFKVWNNWFVGQDIAYHWNGTELETHDIDGRLLTIRGTSETDAWAVGGLVNALVLHYDGTNFEEVNTDGLGQAINGVYTAPGEDVWIGGNFGVTARWNGTGWDQPDLPLTSDHLHAVWHHNDATWWFGGDLFSVGDNHGTIIRHSDDGRIPEIVDCE
jgi:hypothetical protein